MTNVPPDAVIETWDSVYEKSLNLARVIAESCQASGERFDLMMVVPRGAYYPANIVARELGFGATELVHASVRSYEVAEQGEFMVGQMPLPDQITGKNLIIIDEVCDTGKTLNYLVECLYDMGANLVRSGVLHHKPAQTQTGFVPDWSVVTTDKWVVYPWEEHDDGALRSQVRR